MSETRLRPPRVDECARLTALCLRSKAHWGYDTAFMEKCRDELTVDAGTLARHFTRLAERDGAIVGFVELSCGDDTCELEKLFVDPAAMASGIGHILFDAARRHAQECGVSSIVIAADPDAAAFYERMGARRVGEIASGSIPGRSLPRLVLQI